MDDSLPRRTVLRGFGTIPLFNIADHFEPSPTVHWQYEASGELLLTDDDFHDNGTILLGGDGTVISLSMIDGEQQWSFSPTVGRGNTVPVVIADTVFVLRRGAVTVLTLDGTKQLQFALDSNVIPSVSHANATAFVGGNGIYAIDAETGEVRWVSESESVGDVRAVYARANSVYAVTTDTVYSLSTRTGEVRWQESVDTTVGPTRVGIADETLFVRDDRKIVALSAVDGHRKWQFTSDNLEYSHFGDNDVYIWDSQKLHAVNTTEGETKWTFDPKETAVSPLLKRGSVVICATRVAVYALDVETGEIRWQFSRTRGEGPFLSTVIDGFVYIRDKDTVVALDVATGTSRWQFTPEHGLAVTVHSVEDTILIVTDEGQLYAVGPPFRGPVEALVRTSLSTARDELPLVGLFGGIGTVLAVELYRRWNSHPDSNKNSFDIIEELGIDDDIELYRARVSDGQKVIIKRLVDKERSEQFQTVLDTIVALDHEGIPEILDHDKPPAKWVVIPDYEGEPLTGQYEKLTLRRGLLLIARVCEIIHAAHQSGVAHGRLGPEKIRFIGEPTVENAQIVGWISTSTRIQNESTDAFAEAIRKDILQLGGVIRWFINVKDDSRKSAHNDQLRNVITTATATNAKDRYSSALKLADMLRWAVRQ